MSSVFELTVKERNILAEVASRLEPYVQKIAEEWTESLCREEEAGHVPPSPVPLPVRRRINEEAVSFFLASLRSGDLNNYARVLKERLVAKVIDIGAEVGQTLVTGMVAHGIYYRLLGEIFADQPEKIPLAQQALLKIFDLTALWAAEAHAQAKEQLIAAQRAQLEQEQERLRRRTRQLEVEAEVSRHIAAALELDELLSRVVNLVKESFGYYHVHIYLLDKERGELVMREGAGEPGRVMKERGHSVPLGVGLVGEVGQVGRPVLVPDVSKESRWLPNPLLPNTKSELAVPLRLGDEVLGVLDIQSEEVGGLSEDDLLLMETLAGHIAVAIQNAHLFEETRRGMEQTQFLLRVSEVVASTLESTEVMRLIAREVALALGADMTGAYLVDRSRKELLPIAGYHVPPERLEIYRNYRIPLEGLPFVEEAWRTRQSVFSSDITDDPRFDEDARQIFPARSVLLTPMIVKDTIIGVVWAVWWEETRHFTEEERRLVEGIVRQAAVAIENARLFQETQQTLAEIEALYRASWAIGEATSIQGVVRGAAEVAASLGFSACMLTLVTATDEEGRPVQGDIYTTHITREGFVPLEPVIGFPIADPVAAQLVLENPEFVLIYGDAEDPQADIPDVVRERMRSAGIRGLVSLGLGSLEQPLGFLSFGSDTPLTDFPPEYVRRVRTIADQVIIAIERQRLFEEIRRRAERERLVTEITTRVRASMDMETVLRTAVRELGAALGTDRAFIQITGIPDTSAFEQEAE